MTINYSVQAANEVKLCSLCNLPLVVMVNYESDQKQHCGTTVSVPSGQQVRTSNDAEYKAFSIIMIVAFGLTVLILLFDRPLCDVRDESIAEPIVASVEYSARNASMACIGSTCELLRMPYLRS